MGSINLIQFNSYSTLLVNVKYWVNVNNTYRQFYQKFNIAKDLYIAQLLEKYYFTFSSILILKYYELGYYILIFIA